MLIAFLGKIDIFLLHFRKFTDVMLFAGANGDEGKADKKGETPRKSHNAQAQ